MLNTNPFSLLAETISPLAMQGFIVAMIALIALGTIIQMIHHKNITYFFNNAKKAKLQATREEEKGTISWKIKFRNGTTKDFVSPITTKPWGKFIPKLADGEKIKQGELNSQRLYTEPEGLNINGELPAVPKNSFKKGVYY